MVNNNELDALLDALYDRYISRVIDVYNIFIDFFEEANVDLQDVSSRETFKKSILSTSFVYLIEASDDTIDDSIKNSYVKNVPIDILSNVLSTDYAVNKARNVCRCTPSILIHFPQVTVTNENNRSIDIYDLFAKVPVCLDGSLNGKFALNKATYTMNQMKSGYLHSHHRTMPTYDRNCSFNTFQIPCTGTGPINSTMSTLAREYDEDIWKLFCLELNKYVRNESISGVPYIRLENVGNSRSSRNYSTDNFTVYLKYIGFCCLNKEALDSFVKFFIKEKVLKFNYKNNMFSIGMSFVDYMVTISNAFIKWFNKEHAEGNLNFTFENIVRDGLLKYCIVTPSRITYDSEVNNVQVYNSHIGKPVCTFKGRQYTINIIEDTSNIDTDNKSLILDYELSMYILNKIIKVLNYRYGRKICTHESNQLGTETRYL